MATPRLTRNSKGLRPDWIGGDRIRRLSRQFAFVAGLAFVGKVGLAPPPPVRVWEVQVEGDAICEQGRVRPPLDLTLVTRIPARPSDDSGSAVASTDRGGFENFDEIRVELAQSAWAPVWMHDRELWLVRRDALRSTRPRGTLDDLGVELGHVNWHRVRCSEDGAAVRVSLPLWMNPENSTYARRVGTHRCRWDRFSAEDQGSWMQVSRDSLAFSTSRGPLLLESEGIHPTDLGFVSCML